MHEELKGMEQNNVICPNAMVLSNACDKKDIHIVVDFQELNKAVQHPTYQIPQLDAATL